MVREGVIGKVRHEPGLEAQEGIGRADTCERAPCEAGPTGTKLCWRNSREISVADVKLGGKKNIGDIITEMTGHRSEWCQDSLFSSPRNE